MKHTLRFILCLLAISPAFPGIQHVHACNNSSYSLTGFSVVGSGPTAVYTITTQLCVGYGRTGTTFGAEQPTGLFFALAVFGDPGLTSTFTTATNNLTGAPPQNNSYYFSGNYGPTYGIGEVDNLIYESEFGGYYACISNTVDCGNVGSWCQTIVLTYTGMYPDSIRALGIEGIPASGDCSGSDMLVVLGPLPVVWANFTGIVAPSGGIGLNWDAQNTENGRQFVITRKSVGESAFSHVGEVPVAPNASNKTYSFIDPNPTPGVNFYQLQLVNEDGNVDYSSVLTVDYSAPEGLTIYDAYPNPTCGDLKITILSGDNQAGTLTLVNLQGQQILQQSLDLLTGANSISLDLDECADGVYFLRVQTPRNGSERKIVLQ